MGAPQPRSGGGRNRPTGEGGRGAQPALPTEEDPANLAPLKAPPQTLKAGEMRTTFDVIYYVEILPPAAASEEEAAK